MGNLLWNRAVVVAFTDTEEVCFVAVALKSLPPRLNRLRKHCNWIGFFEIDPSAAKADAHTKTFSGTIKIVPFQNFAMNANPVRVVPRLV